MAQLNFLLPKQSSIVRLGRLDRAMLIGHDRQPRPFATKMDGDVLTVDPVQPESGTFHLPCHIEGFGDVYLGTAQLMYGSTLYSLVLELARGQINQIRNQIGKAQLRGWSPSAHLNNRLKNATEALSQAVRLKEVEQQRLAHASLNIALDCAETLIHELSAYAFETESLNSMAIRNRLGAAIDLNVAATFDPQEFGRTFGFAQIPVRWREIISQQGECDWSKIDQQIDWCKAASVEPIIGPLIDFRPDLLPTWLETWKTDPQMLVTLMIDHVESFVQHYTGRIKHWHSVLRANCSDLYMFREPQMLWLTKRILQAMHQVDPSAEVTVGVSQPWGDYWALRNGGLSPPAFVDSLIRTVDSPIKVQLEIAMGFHRYGSYCRSLLDLSQLLDQYQEMGAALSVSLAFPSHSDDCSGALGQWHHVPDEQTQAKWANEATRLCLSKSFVERVFWAEFRDGPTSDWPLAGLLDSAGNAKPIFSKLSSLTSDPPS